MIRPLRCKVLGDKRVRHASYLSQGNFEKLLNGDEEASLEVGLKYWRLVKLGLDYSSCIGSLERFVRGYIIYITDQQRMSLVGELGDR